MAEEQHARYVEGGVRAVDPALALTVFAGAASCNVAIEFGVSGPNSTNGMSCASGTIAIGDGFRAIVRGDADVMLAGGAEAPLAPLCFGAFAIIRAMSTRNDDPGTASRPFDAGPRRLRDGRGRGGAGAGGAGPGAGAGRADLRRGLRLRPHQRRPPHDRAASRRRAGGARHAHGARRGRTCAPRRVGYINAHGSSTPLNDSTETAGHPAGVRRRTPSAWPSAAPRATTATPSARAAPSRRPSAPWRATGAGSRRRSTSATPDPACDLDYLAGGGRAARPEYLLSNSFGFGGINAALVLRRAD